MKFTRAGVFSSFSSRRMPGALGVRLAPLLACAALMLAPSVAANAAEHTLAGIKVFASVNDVLARYGNPNRIITDSSQFSATTSSSANASAASPAMMGQQSAPQEFGGGRMRGGAPEMGGVPGLAVTANAYAAPGSPGQDSSSSSSSAVPGEVMYVYNRPGNVTVAFLLSPDGRVIQITVLGYKSAGVKTGRGLQLGTLYKVMINRYGYPEGQATSNGVLTATYLQRDHASFQLRNNHIVGITVAAVE